MALILSFDTSGPACAVAVLRGDQVLAAAEEAMARGQAERLMPLIGETLAAAEVTLADLDAVAVGTGPGNFTGIRLSVSAARGLSLSLGCPAIGVSALEAFACDGPRPVVALRDARRGAVYAQTFQTDTPDTPRLIENTADLPEALPRVGDAPEAAPPALPMAVAIARIAATRLHETPVPPAPLYIRPADAAPARDSGPTLLS